MRTLLKNLIRRLSSKPSEADVQTADMKQDEILQVNLPTIILEHNTQSNIQYKRLDEPIMQEQPPMSPVPLRRKPKSGPLSQNRQSSVSVDSSVSIWEPTPTTKVTVTELSLPAFMHINPSRDIIMKQKLADGGNCRVYECTVKTADLQARTFGLKTCCKVLTKAPTDPEQNRWSDYSMGAFHQEIAIMWKFRDHPLFPSLYGYCDFPPTILMQCYDQGSLEEYSLGTAKASITYPYSKVQLISLFKDLASAIQHFHKQGFVHADIKPLNVLLNNKNFNYKLSIILTDFGITQVVDYDAARQVSAFQPILIKGASISYAAPEVLLAKSFREISEISQNNNESKFKVFMRDIYAYSVSMFECLTRTEVYVPQKQSLQDSNEDIY